MGSFGIHIIHGEDVEKALLPKEHLFLAGKLELPQKGFKHIDSITVESLHDVNIEVGIGFYPSFTANSCHLHSVNWEYNYVIEGRVDILSLATGDEYSCGRGSLFIIDPNTPYASKNAAGTKVLFWKIPGGNDKVLISPSNEAAEWLSRQI